jgi:hypothetical protein
MHRPAPAAAYHSQAAAAASDVAVGDTIEVAVAGGEPGSAPGSSPAWGQPSVAVGVGIVADDVTIVSP